MALWLFRLRGGRKRSRSGAALTNVENAPPRSLTGGAVARAASKRQPRSGLNKPDRRARTYSFSPDRQESIYVDRSSRIPEASGENGHMNGPSASPQDPLWDRAPTLHHKRSSNNIMRKKSSKRRKQDHNREAEIKAMSSLVPVRSATDAMAARRATKRAHKRVNTFGVGQSWGDPASEISLPIPASLHSSLSSESERFAYKISSLDALAPRPTLRYQPGTRLLSSRASVGVRSGSQKPPLADRGPIAEETLHAHKRINDLADDFDASELRELMERDARRHERQLQHDREKLERRLARRAEKQRREESQARDTGVSPPENLERGVMGREVGLGIDPPSTVVTSSKQRTSPEPMTGVDIETTATPQETSKEPLKCFHRTDTAPENTGIAPSKDEKLEPGALEEPVSAVPPSLRLETTLNSKTSKSGSTLNSEKDKASSAIDDDEATRKDSVTSNKANRLSWTTLLRWGKAHRNSNGPSSFSNTSREEMAAAAAATTAAQAQSPSQTQLTEDDFPVPSPTGNYIMSKSRSGVPKRTRSRFREDLPELPLSPPETRLKSIEVEPPLPIVAEHKAADSELAQQVFARDDTSTSGHRSIDIPQQTAGSREPHLSMSLASIDSEGSWLSGRVGSQRKASVRDKTRKVRREHDHTGDSQSNSAHDDLEVAEDDYMSRLSPDLNANSSDAHQSGDGRRSSDEDVLMEEDVRWGAVGAQPQLVSVHNHDRDTFHSREGLLNMDSGDEDGTNSPVSPVSPVSQGTEDKIDLQHARSVHVGRGHVRNFSAGSARLLEIGPRSSVDSASRSRERKYKLEHQP